MADREKIIKGLETCRTRVHCKECPYAYDKRADDSYCEAVLHNDVLELLKEQEWNLLTEDDEGIIHGLPGDDGQHLMTDGRDIWIDDYMDGVDDGIFLDSGRDVREIKAWMYMPKLPEEGR